MKTLSAIALLAFCFLGCSPHPTDHPTISSDSVKIDSVIVKDTVKIDSVKVIDTTNPRRLEE